MQAEDFVLDLGERPNAIAEVYHCSPPLTAGGELRLESGLCALEIFRWNQHPLPCRVPERILLGAGVAVQYVNVPVDQRDLFRQIDVSGVSLVESREPSLIEILPVFVNDKSQE